MRYFLYLDINVSEKWYLQRPIAMPIGEILEVTFHRSYTLALENRKIKIRKKGRKRRWNSTLFWPKVCGSNNEDASMTAKDIKSLFWLKTRTC